jgi:hypothetical protein
LGSPWLGRTVSKTAVTKVNGWKVHITETTDA